MMFLPSCGILLLASAADAFLLNKLTGKALFVAARQAYDDYDEPYDDVRPTRYKETMENVYYKEPYDAMTTPPPFDYYEEQEEDDYYDERRRRPQTRAPTSSANTAPRPMPLDRPRQYRDSFYDDEEEEEEDAPPPGNFWSNPTRSVDTTAPSKRSRPTGRRPPRSSIPRRDYTPPNAALDFYQRLFWYGVEDDDDDMRSSLDDSDRTLFGGTKGKFNGLSFLGKAEDTRVRRRPRTRDYDEEWDVEPPRRRSDIDSAPRRRSRDETTPRQSDLYDEQPRQNDIYDEQPRRKARYKDEFEDPRRPYDDRRSGVTPPSDPPAPMLQSMLEAFFGSREDPVAAARYDEIIQGRPRPSRQRPGYAYPYEPQRTSRYDGANEDVPTDRRPEEFYDESNARRRENSIRNDAKPRASRSAIDEDEAEEIVIDTETVPVVEAVPTNNTATVQNAPSWEERALAMERVPPDTIPAWGPTGDLGLHAREKAVQDALEDLKLAEATVRDFEVKCRDAKEEIAILRVDVELERRRLRESDRLSPRQMNELLRRLDRKVEDASRASRLQQQRLEAAKQELEDLRTRHWAVLRCYDPDLASQAISEAVQESSAQLNLEGPV